jgi:hypothetical protein
MHLVALGSRIPTYALLAGTFASMLNDGTLIGVAGATCHLQMLGRTLTSGSSLSFARCLSAAQHFLNASFSYAIIAFDLCFRLRVVGPAVSESGADSESALSESAEPELHVVLVGEILGSGGGEWGVEEEGVGAIFGPGV